ncbi:hemolysin family protein [Fictibacillus sp. JL2B1089]|uniref:hemolysin family protein n=1 Tax=Fictibacillus sp. JL2B1089 TaxID=3399565 RepID=UPI003A8925E8
MEIINLIMVAILIALTAFFVATEFAIVKIRTTRLDQLVAEGNTKAVAARKVVGNLDEYLSACQLGITITALGLGWLGEPTVEHLLHPLFVEFDLSESVSSILSFIIAFALITFLHVVIGELAPKTLAIQKAEAVTLRIAKPIMFFYKIMYPFIKTLNGSARIFTGWFGLKPASEHELAHSEEELRLILSESYKSGEINQSEFKYVNNIFQFDDRTAKEIMVPRVDMVTLDKSETVRESIAVVTEENYTRYPIIDGDKDSVIGMVNMKQVLTDFVNGKNPDASLEEYVRPVIQVFETMPIHDLLLKMQKERVHMAILIDEYGGTSGLVTVEDILEEIVGEIRDEFDEDEVPDIKKIDENRTILDGKVLISEVNDLFGLNINDEDVDTIGGWILSEKMEIKMGDEVSVENYRFKILEIDGYHVKSLEVLNVKNEESIN